MMNVKFDRIPHNARIKQENHMLGGELTIHMAICRAINAEIWGEKGKVRRGSKHRACAALTHT